MAIVARRVRQVGAFSRPVHSLLWFTLFLGLGRAVWSLLFYLYLKEAGYREDFIGDLNLVMGLGSAAAAPLAAWLSNRLGRQRLMLAGGALEIISLLGLVWLPSRAALVALMAVFGIAFPLWLVPYNPFLAENSRPEERVVLFSTVNMIWLGTAMGGSVLGGWLPQLFAAGLPWASAGSVGQALGAGPLLAYRLAATSGATLYLPALACLWSAGRVTHQAVQVTSSAVGAAVDGEMLSWRARLPSGALSLVASFLGVSLLLGLGFGSYFPFITLYFKEHLGASASVVGLVVGAGQAAGVAGLVLAPTLAARLGKVRAVTVAQLSAMPCLVAMALAGGLPAGVAAYVLRYAIWNMGSSTFDAFQMEAVSDRLRALLNSVAGIPSGIGFNLAWAVGSAVAGRLIVAYGYPAIFLAAIAFTVPGTALYYQRFRRLSHPVGA